MFSLRWVTCLRKLRACFASAAGGKRRAKTGRRCSPGLSRSMRWSEGQWFSRQFPEMAAAFQFLILILILLVISFANRSGTGD